MESLDLKQSLCHGHGFNPKLVVVTRQDLSKGYRAVQSTHAAINFTFEHPSRAGPWFQNSNYLVQLEVANEAKLRELIRKCEQNQLCYTVFREPDIGNQITAICIEPSPITQKLCKNLPLLFKNEINKNETDKHSFKNSCNEGKSIQLYQENPVQEKTGTDF